MDVGAADWQDRDAESTRDDEFDLLALVGAVGNRRFARAVADRPGSPNGVPQQSSVPAGLDLAELERIWASEPRDVDVPRLTLAVAAAVETDPGVQGRGWSVTKRTNLVTEIVRSIVTRHPPRSGGRRGGSGFPGATLEVAAEGLTLVRYADLQRPKGTSDVDIFVRAATALASVRPKSAPMTVAELGRGVRNLSEYLTAVADTVRLVDPATAGVIVEISEDRLPALAKRVDVTGVRQMDSRDRKGLRQIATDLAKLTELGRVRLDAGLVVTASVLVGLPGVERGLKDQIDEALSRNATRAHDLVRQITQVAPGLGRVTDV